MAVNIIAFYQIIYDFTVILIFLWFGPWYHAVESAIMVIVSLMILYADRSEIIWPYVIYLIYMVNFLNFTMHTV